MASRKQRSHRCCRTILRDCLTLTRSSSSMDPCTWRGTAALQGSYPTACIAELWTSDRLPSPPACRWPCCPSWPRTPCTTQRWPPPWWTATLTAPPAPCCEAPSLEWWAAGFIPSYWHYPWTSASPPRTKRRRCRRRGMFCASRWSSPDRSWGRWGRCCCSRPSSAPTWAPGTLNPTPNWRS